jgi:hypothetical protein
MIMKQKRTFIPLFYLFLMISGSLFAIGEKTYTMGGSIAWKDAETRQGITEINALRPGPVLALASGVVAGKAGEAGTVDMALSFDEGRPTLFIDGVGHYRVKSSDSSAVSAAGPQWARMGQGAVLFSASTGNFAGSSSAALGAGQRVSVSGGGPLTIEPYRGDALFSPGRNMRDFTLEFWVYPLNMENGEQLLSWFASNTLPNTGLVSQRIQCVVTKNRFQWSFENFFFAPHGSQALNLALTSQSSVVPKTWSHHLIRFDADTGFLEYMVNGNSEAIVYATSSGREEAEVYTPLVGEGGIFTLGNRFSGMIDEFRIHRSFTVDPSLQRYAATGGRIESRTIDLGENSGLLKLEASGGRISLREGRARNDYAGSGDFRFADNSAVQFFLRAGDNPYRWTETDWRVVMPGADLSDLLKGRYVQVAAALYPSGDGETSPYLEEIRILYRPNQPPRPPSQLMAVASDGAVVLSWKNSSDLNTSGYLVYYGTARGEYFGKDADLGVSPLDAGKRSSLRIEGLQNGTVYYFAVAAYSHTAQLDAFSRGENWRENSLQASRAEAGGSPPHVGEFSREVSARPLRD